MEWDYISNIAWWFIWTMSLHSLRSKKMILDLSLWFCGFFFLSCLTLSNLLAESDDARTYMVYNRWGRVGIKGQDKLFGPYNMREAAIAEFEKKFYDKTKNHWFARKEFVFHPKCYMWLEMDYDGKEKESVVSIPKSM